MTDTLRQISAAHIARESAEGPEAANRGESISFIVIARNEEEHVGKCLDAAIREASALRGEVVFVDCGSMDGTLAVAKSYPVNVLKMSRGTVLSAAAARHVGTLNSTGKFVMFIDGDCVLAPGWSRVAVRTLVENPNVAAVTGRLNEVYLEQGVVVGEKADPFGQTPDVPTPTIWLGGNATYRRSALELVDGGFNPAIRSLEEPELCFRLMKKGLIILSVPEKMATHYTEKRWTVRTVIGRFTRGLCLGYGQVLRSSLRHGFVRAYVCRESRTFLFFVSCALGMAAFAADCLRGQVLLTPLWTVLAFAPFLYMAIKNRSAKWPLLMYLTWFLNCLGMLQGLLKYLPRCSECQVEYSVVKVTAPAGLPYEIARSLSEFSDAG